MLHIIPLHRGDNVGDKFALEITKVLEDKKIYAIISTGVVL